MYRNDPSRSQGLGLGCSIPIFCHVHVVNEPFRWFELPRRCFVGRRSGNEAYLVKEVVESMIWTRSIENGWLSLPGSIRWLTFSVDTRDQHSIVTLSGPDTQVAV